MSVQNTHNADPGVLSSIGSGLREALRFLRGLVLVLVVAGLAVFTVQNMAVVDLQFAQWSVQAPRAALILGIFALGSGCGFPIGATRRHR